MECSGKRKNVSEIVTRHHRYCQDTNANNNMLMTHWQLCVSLTTTTTQYLDSRHLLSFALSHRFQVSVYCIMIGGVILQYKRTDHISIRWCGSARIELARGTWVASAGQQHNGLCNPIAVIHSDSFQRLSAQLYSEIMMSKCISALMNLHSCLSKKTRLWNALTWLRWLVVT